MKSKSHKGFTLTETVLAIGIVGVLLVVFVAMFFPARRSVQAALTIQEADRIVKTLTSELNTVRPDERTASSVRVSTRNRYTSSFDKAFYWMLFTAKPETTILIYNYRGDLNKPLREDGTYQPATDDAGIPGSGTVLIPACTLASNKLRWEDFRATVGPVFAVRMTQLVVEQRGTQFQYMLTAKPGVISNPYDYKRVINKPEDYVYDPANKRYPAWGAEVMYFAEFFQLNSPSPERMVGMKWEQLKNPVFSRNLVFRR